MPAHDFDDVIAGISAWHSLSPDFFPRTIPPRKRLIGLNHSTKDEDGVTTKDVVAEIIHRTREQQQDKSLGVTFTIGITEAVSADLKPNVVPTSPSNECSIVPNPVETVPLERSVEPTAYGTTRPKEDPMHVSL
mmetsp:Transcript_76252/g.135075  ORF Transcript_76252/g.135075 Transcript_76252/m.135075 type:complete len:134 (+) Transcript_76252:3-404(+)